MSLMDEPQVHVGIVRRVKDRDGGYTEYVVNLSRIPLTASKDVVAMMLGQVQAGFEAITQEIEDRVRGAIFPNPAAFHPHVDPAREAVTPPRPDPEPNDPAPVDVSGKVPEDFDFDDAYNQNVRETGGVFHLDSVSVDSEPDIPADDEVRSGGEAFGIEIPVPPYDWLTEPITKIGGEGDGGQCKALNSALTGAGYGGKARHPAALAILRAYGPIHDHGVRDGLASISDLSKAEAHVLLSWFEEAGRFEIAALAAAIQPCKEACSA